ncbi:hypothetical protein [Hymenobacter cellulosilyticus]|uniref:Uncharacterized protein n=1 Tax=Hymenobacter cellulosilyticus TaxID=2932248 RepID=A0A8T9QCS7_9BACT|nr:hypothetical protein [Hymenobacter cellulosilyticus]UOQ74732.1 hypothetical protein MUN79_13150 [Hymenobacter cellulosilyticus]
MNVIVKRLLITTGVVVALMVGAYTCWLIVLAHAFGAFDPTYTKADLIRHYEAKAPELWALNAYINSIVPAHQSVDIEFDGQRTIPIFHLKVNGIYDSNWDVKWDSAQADTLLHQLGWTRQTLTTLQAKLDQAGCISIASGEPCTIGYQRSGMGKYSYNLFSGPLSDSLKVQYSSGCTHIVYKPQVVLEYGGGAVGPQCFEEQ